MFTSIQARAWELCSWALFFLFDARAEKTRTLFVTVMPATGSFVDYARIGYVSVGRGRGNDLLHYEYTFSMQEPSDGNAMLLFAFGQNANDVVLDNVSLYRER